jgi:hypothetical protein
MLAQLDRTGEDQISLTESRQPREGGGYEDRRALQRADRGRREEQDDR